MNMMPDIETQLGLIRRGAAEIISEEELRQKLTVGFSASKPLLIKAGFDPSAPDLHLGHMVLLRKLRHFQQLGHQVLFLIGDFTGMIGDPTGKSELRKRLTREQVQENAQTYQQQVGKILDLEKTRIVYNSVWFEKMTPHDFLGLSARLTVAQLLAREDFKQRYSQGKDISLLEFMYPLLQGYDSVHLRADVELGGTDQKFNLLVGRQLQRDWGMPQQAVLMMPLLVGLDGTQKMSKSLNNYVGIDEPPVDMFAKIMSINDEVMFRYYELLTDLALPEIESRRTEIAAGRLHPKHCKEDLAERITADFHGGVAARGARETFASRFGGGTDWTNRENFLPCRLPASAWENGRLWICRLLVLLNAAPSNAEARRLVQQRAVMLDGAIIDDVGRELAPPSPEYMLKVGKKQFFRVSCDG